MLPAKANKILVSDALPEKQEEEDEANPLQNTKVWKFRVVNEEGDCELLSVEDGSNVVKSSEKIYEHIKVDEDDEDYEPEQDLYEDIQVDEDDDYEPEEDFPRAKRRKKEKAPLSSSSKKNNSSGKNTKHLKFDKDWLEEFPFLGYEEDKNLMFCKLCRKYIEGYRKSSPFIVGTNHFRESMIRCHKRCTMHLESEELSEALLEQDKEVVEKNLFQENLSTVFKSVYFIYKNKMPYMAFPQLCESLKKEGTPLPAYSTQKKACPLLGKFIALGLEKEIAQRLVSVSEFSLIIDASYRRSTESHDMVYIKYIDGLLIQTVFLGIIDSNSKEQDAIHNAISNLFERYNLNDWHNRVVYIMTDKSDGHLWMEGFIEIIDKMSLPNFISEVKYLPHKVKFCSNIVQSYKAASAVDALLHSIYCCYEKINEKNDLVHMNKAYESIVELYGNLPKSSFVALYYETIKALEDDYDTFVSILTKDQQLLTTDFKTRQRNKSILKVLTRSSFICKMAVLIDIFSCLYSFGVQLGNEGVMPYDVHILLEEVCSELEKAGSCGGVMAERISEELSAHPGIFRDIEITDDGHFDNLRSEMDSFSQDLICYLRSLIDNTLLEKSFIFSTGLWPEEEDLKDFGDSEFVEIFLCFKGDSNLVEDAVREWQLFKLTVLSQFPEEVRQDSKPVLLKMLAEHGDAYPLVASVLKKILLLNFEDSEIKRGYQEMCLSKSHHRSVMSVQSMQTSMMISMHGPSIGEFDCSLALDIFLHSRSRKFLKKLMDQKFLKSSYSFTLSESADSTVE